MRNKRLEKRMAEKNEILKQSHVSDEEPVGAPPSELKQKKNKAKKTKKKNKSDNTNVRLDHPTVIEFDYVKFHRKSFGWTRMLSKIGTGFIILLCIYFLYLTYGVYVTNFVYDDSGKVIAEQMSIDDIQKNKEYKMMEEYYLRAREIYEQTLSLDYQLSVDAADSVLIATQYEDLLTPISTLSVQLSGQEVSSKYAQFKTMLLTWVQTDIAVYLQNMSAAISQNSNEKANQALEYKERTYNDFSIITKNLTGLSEDVKDVDVADIQAWSPSEYIAKNITGVE